MFYENPSIPILIFIYCKIMNYKIVWISFVAI
jgi:hypothetical protein